MYNGNRKVINDVLDSLSNLRTDKNVFFKYRAAYLRFAPYIFTPKPASNTQFDSIRSVACVVTFGSYTNNPI